MLLIEVIAFGVGTELLMLMFGKTDAILIYLAACLVADAAIITSAVRSKLRRKT